MAIETVLQFVDALRESRLLDPKQTEELDALQASFTDPRVLARDLIQRGWLTPYQVNQIVQGHGKELVLGAYRLLERLGAGGMGQVFKARHQGLNKIVALKVIRREHLTNPEAVHRFQREIRAAAQLSHPNIVMAFDADQVGDAHFFAMEFVDGVDLAQMVKQSGALPVPIACAYVRQAALGLQHAHERGLVHRDIKPANLLAARASGSHPTLSVDPAESAAAATVKILDMGLARFSESSNSLSWKTQDGKVLGTPDYIAPEQALKSSAADIRADLYSLGCTFYYLLAGRVPFPGGTMMEKLLKHKLDEPTPLEKVRADVPAAVAAIVRKLMAKKPETRYQTPAELAAALSAVTFDAAPASTPRAIPVHDSNAPPLAIPLGPETPHADARLGLMVGAALLLVLAALIVLLLA